MKHHTITTKQVLSVAAMAFVCVSVISCKDKDIDDNGNGTESKELADEWYAGGKLGTTFNATASAYEDPTPAIEEAGRDLCKTLPHSLSFLFLSTISPLSDK